MLHCVLTTQSQILGHHIFDLIYTVLPAPETNPLRTTVEVFLPQYQVLMS